MKIIKRNTKLIIGYFLSLIVGLLLGYHEYYKDYTNYIDLKLNGVIVDTKSELKPKIFGSQYCDYYFITNSGEIIKKSVKCDKDRFEKFYKNLKVIYNPLKPKGFMEYTYFANYSISYKIFFYSLLSIGFSLCISLLFTLLLVANKVIKSLYNDK